MSERYCVDSSAWIQAWTRAYPITRFPSFWERMRFAADEQLILTPEEVLTDLKAKADGLHKWVSGRNGVVRPMTNEQFAASQDILKQYPRFVHERTGRNRSDTFVVALAELEACCVVTQETPSEKPHKVLKLPDICNERNIRWIPILNFIDENGWTF